MRRRECARASLFTSTRGVGLAHVDLLRALLLVASEALVTHASRPAQPLSAPQKLHASIVQVNLLHHASHALAALV